MTNRWLDRRLDELGKTKAGLARAMGVSPPTINKIITGIRKVQAEEVPAMATYIELPEEQVLRLISGKRTHATVESAPQRGPRPTISVRVVGAVQAGQLNSWAEWPFDKQFDIPAPIPMRYQNFNVRAFQVIGPSMDQLYPDGSYVIVAPTIEIGWRPKTGQRVLVQRVTRFAGVEEYETTVKEIIVEGNELLLIARSDHPDFKGAKPWRIPAPQDEPVFDEMTDSVRIVGLVIGSWREEPLA